MATGYGSDVWAQDRIVSSRIARKTLLVAQALYRRLITPRGTLIGGPEEENYGVDLSSFVGRHSPERVAAMLRSVISGELTKDDRVSSVTASVEYSLDAAGMATFEITIDVLLFDEDQDFSLTLSVSSVTASLVGFNG